VVLKTVSTLGATGGGGGGGVSSVTASSPIASSGGTTPNISLTGTVPVANGGTGVTVSTGPNSVVLRDASNNVTANAYFNGFNSITASGTAVTLTVDSAPVQYVSGSGGQTIKLPDATTLLNGTIFSFNNNQSSGAITVNNNSNTLVVSVPSGAYVTVILLSNATAAGSWDRHDQTPSNTSWSTNTLDYPGSITSATWNGTTVQVNRGGTGLATIPAGNVVIGNGTSALYGIAPGTAGNVLTSIGGAWVSNAAVGGGGGGSPGGSTTQVQYNNAGSFAGSANLTFNGTTLTAAGLAGPLNGTVGATTPAAGTFTSVGYKGATSGTLTLTANAVAGTQNYTLPTAYPTVDGQVLSSNIGGVMSWTSTLPNFPTSVEYLVVAGGGGAASGGGGAGGLLTANSISVTGGTQYTVTVGGGGAGALSINVAVNGSNSVFYSVTATGGGKGGSDTNTNAGNGGSGGGGGAANFSNSGGTGVSGQGFAGGNTTIFSPPYPAAGGGGASAAGGNSAGASTGGAGGAGITYTTGTSITGLATSYAGGGGGAVYGGGTGGAGGTGGGGAGAGSGAGTAGTANTGGGGGGGTTANTGGAGGSGVVIIAYLSTFADLASIGTGLTTQSWNGSAWVNNSAGVTTPNTTIRSGYKVYRFSAGTGSIQW